MVLVEVEDEVDNRIIKSLKVGPFHTVTPMKLIIPPIPLGKSRFGGHIKRENVSPSTTRGADGANKNSILGLVKSEVSLGIPTFPGLMDVEIIEILDIQGDIATLVESNIEILTIEEVEHLLKIKGREILLHNVLFNCYKLI